MKKLQLAAIIAIIVITNSISVNAQYTWTQKANFPGGPRSGVSCFSIGNYGYVGGGQTTSGYVYEYYRWDKNTNSWSQIATYPGAASYGCTYFAIGGKGYIGLGINGSAATDLWSYDTGSNAWTQMASFPGVGRYSAFAFVIGANAYVCCGNPGAPPYQTDCWK
jgi:N-acetylneuraminic acid mutarotase